MHGGAQREAQIPQQQTGMRQDQAFFSVQRWSVGNNTTAAATHRHQGCLKDQCINQTRSQQPRKPTGNKDDV